MVSLADEPHDPIVVFQILHARVIKKIAPGIRDESGTGQTLATIALIILASFGGVWAGFYIDTSYLHPPTVVYGVCAPPAYISNGNCFVNQQVTQQVNGQPTTQTVQVPSGYLLNPFVYNSSTVKGTP